MWKYCAQGAGAALALEKGSVMIVAIAAEKSLIQDLENRNLVSAYLNSDFAYPQFQIVRNLFSILGRQLGRSLIYGRTKFVGGYFRDWGERSLWVTSTISKGRNSRCSSLLCA